MPLQHSTRRCAAAKKEKAKAAAYTIRLRQPIDSTLANYSWTVAQNAAVLLHK